MRYFTYICFVALLACNFEGSTVDISQRMFDSALEKIYEESWYDDLDCILVNREVCYDFDHWGFEKSIDSCSVLAVDHTIRSFVEAPLDGVRFGEELLASELCHLDHEHDEAKSPALKGKACYLIRTSPLAVTDEYYAMDFWIKNWSQDIGEHYLSFVFKSRPEEVHTIRYVIDGNVN